MFLGWSLLIQYSIRFYVSVLGVCQPTATSIEGVTTHIGTPKRPILKKAPPMEMSKKTTGLSICLSKQQQQQQQQGKTEETKTQRQGEPWGSPDYVYYKMVVARRHVIGEASFAPSLHHSPRQETQRRSCRSVGGSRNNGTPKLSIPYFSHRIHVWWYIYLLIYHKNQQFMWMFPKIGVPPHHPFQ